MGAFQELGCLAGKQQNFSASNLPAELMPTAELGGLSVQCVRNPASCASTVRSWHFQPLLSLAVSGVCLMQDEGQKTSVESLAGLPRCLCRLQSTLDAPNSWKLTVF